MKYKIIPLFMGKTKVDRSAFEYRHPIGEMVEDAFGCFAVKSQDEIILFDSGLPSQEEIHRIGLTFGYMENAPDVEEVFRKAGIVPEEIKTIVLSHLHWDHAWNLELFPNARILVQREEMRHAISPNKHERSAYTLSQNCEGCPGWLRGLSRMEALDGDCELRPGLRVITTPGHTPGSQSLLVDTEEGLYALVSDFALTERNYTECVPIAIFTSVDDWYASHRKLKALGAKILPTHEVSVYSRESYG